MIFFDLNTGIHKRSSNSSAAASAQSGGRSVSGDVKSGGGSGKNRLPSLFQKVKHAVRFELFFFHDFDGEIRCYVFLRRNGNKKVQGTVLLALVPTGTATVKRWDVCR